LRARVARFACHVDLVAPALRSVVRAASSVFVIFRSTHREIFFLPILQRRRNHIRTAGPFAQVDRAAALAAERKLRVGILHPTFTNRTTQFDRPFARHKRNEETSDQPLATSDYFSHQIILMRVHDLAAIKLTRLRVHPVGDFVHEDFAVNFRRVHCGPAFQEQVCLFRETFK
jgi:hypothetical protein